MGPTYYRGCWHVVGSPLFLRYHHPPEADFSRRKEVYAPKGFFLHAASLGQAFAHCRIFSTAASRRSGTRVSVSLLGNSLSAPLPVIGLVGHYLTNYLIGPRPIVERLTTLLRPKSETIWNYLAFRQAMPNSTVCTKVLLTRSPLPTPLLNSNLY